LEAVDMKRSLAIPLATAVCMCTAGVPAHAHHSYGLFFDTCTSVTVEGQIEAVLWKDPHVWLDLKTDDGTAYRIEWTGPQNLKRDAVAADTLKAGDRVVVAGSPPRDRSQTRIAYPAPNVVSVLTQIRRPADGWSWMRTPGFPPSECARK